MQVILLKKYKPHSRELQVGTEMGVTNELGIKLIAKGIAKNVTKEYDVKIIKKRKELAVEIETVKELEKGKK